MCFSCKNKSDMREVLSRLELIQDRLGTMRNIVSLGVTQRIACTTMNGVARTQKRHFDTLMSQCPVMAEGRTKKRSASVMELCLLVLPFLVIRRVVAPVDNLLVSHVPIGNLCIHIPDLEKLVPVVGVRQPNVVPVGKLVLA